MFKAALLAHITHGPGSVHTIYAQVNSVVQWIFWTVVIILSII